MSLCGGAAVLRNAEAVRHQQLPEHDVATVGTVAEAVIGELEVFSEALHGACAFEVGRFCPCVPAVTGFVIAFEKPALFGHGSEVVEELKRKLPLSLQVMMSPPRILDEVADLVVVDDVAVKNNAVRLQITNEWDDEIPQHWLVLKRKLDVVEHDPLLSVHFQRSPDADDNRLGSSWPTEANRPLRASGLSAAD